MKTKILILLISCVLFTSCEKEEIMTYGDIVITMQGVTGYDGILVKDLRLGIFDMNVLITNRFFESEAIQVKPFISEKYEFKELLPGNYVLGFIGLGYRKTVQVKAGQTLKIDLFK